MAHELDTTYGLDEAMIYVGETPWHQHGIKLDSPPATVEEGMAMCHLDFEVDTRPIEVVLSEGGEVTHQPVGETGLSTFTVSRPHRQLIKSHKSVVRTDTGKVLGVVGSRYAVLQNADAFKALNPLLDSGLASIETMGSLRGGADIWMLVRFHLDDDEIKRAFEAVGDEIATFGLATNNHAGKFGARYLDTPVRVVCANTLDFATVIFDHARDEDLSLRRGISVRHTGDVAERAKEAAEELWGEVVRRYRIIGRQYQVLRETPLSVEQFTKAVLDTVATVPTNPEAFSTEGYFEGARDRALAKRESVTRLWDEGKGHTGDHSAWEAYNGLTEALDHDPDGVFKTRNKVASMFDGGIAATKTKALKRIVKVAA